MSPAVRIRLGALGVAALLAALSLWTLATAPRPLPAASQGSYDLELYRAIVERLQRGENYYQAAGTELRRPRGPLQLAYPTRSVFNWRLPTLAWLLGRWSDWRWARLAFMALSVITVWLTWRALAGTGARSFRLVATALLGSGLLWGWPGWPVETLLVHECWAGLLLALAVAARTAGWTRLALFAGLAALFIRELALPAVLLFAYVAVREKRWGEAVAWGLGIAGFAVVMYWHAAIVQRLILPTDRAMEYSWLQFGGWGFILKTAHLHPLLLGFLQSQPLIVGLLLPLSLGGFLLVGEVPMLRLAALLVAAYVLAFALVGLPFNFLWGLLYTPLWPLGLLGWWPQAAAATPEGAKKKPPSS